MMTIVPPVSGIAYVPDANDPTHWRNELVTLTGFNTSNVLIKMVTTNGNGNNLYIDNINLEQSSPTALHSLESLSEVLTLGPNPSASQFKLSFQNESTAPIQVLIMDVAGKCVWNQTYSSASSVLVQHQLPAGSYQLKINRENAHWIKSIIVNP